MRYNDEIYRHGDFPGIIVNGGIMNMESVEKEIRQLLSDIFELGDEMELTGQQLYGCTAWDSFKIVQLLTELMDSYGVTIELDELQEFETMQDVMDWITSRLGKGKYER